MRLRLLLCCILILSGLSLAHAVSFSSEIAVNEAAQNFIHQKEFENAFTIFDTGLEQFPESDWLHFQYGALLYQQNKLEEAEEQLQISLKLNDRTKTQVLLEKVRKKASLLKPEEESSLMSTQTLIRILLTTLLASFVPFFISRSSKFKDKKLYNKALKKKDWDTVTDILEDDLSNQRFPSLRGYLRQLLSSMPQEEAERIIIHYVDNPAHEEDLIKMLRKTVNKTPEFNKTNEAA